VPLASLVQLVRRLEAAEVGLNRCKDYWGRDLGMPWTGVFVGEDYSRLQMVGLKEE